MFVLHATNTGDRPQDLYLRGREPTFDVEVYTARGDFVWRRLRLVLVPAITLITSLDPGANLRLETQWDLHSADGKLVPAGSYLACGLLLVEGGVWTSPLRSFEIGGPAA